MATVLRTLLIDRHLVSHGEFLREYDRVASAVEPGQVGHGPTKSQYYRWIWGQLRTLPRGHHCRVLEAMFPGWTADQLFATPSDGLSLLQGRHFPGDITAVFADRGQFLASHSPESLFEGARSIAMAGMSLNMLCQAFPERRVRDLLESGTVIRALFLDPAGQHVELRETEEGLGTGTLRALITLNVSTLQHIRAALSPVARDRLQIRTYDEPPRLNVTVVDGVRCIAQLYLPHTRAGDSPTLLLDKAIPYAGGLFQVFTTLFEAMWNRATVQPLPALRRPGCYERRVVPFRRIARGSYPVDTHAS